MDEWMHAYLELFWVDGIQSYGTDGDCEVGEGSSLPMLIKLCPVITMIPWTDGRQLWWTLRSFKIACSLSYMTKNVDQSIWLFSSMDLFSL